MKEQKEEYFKYGFDKRSFLFQIWANWSCFAINHIYFWFGIVLNDL